MLLLTTLLFFWTPMTLLVLFYFGFVSWTLICSLYLLPATMTGKADRKCCVPACGKTRSEDVTLHVFPNPDKEPDRFRTWLYAIGGDILALDNLKIFKHRKVCHAHFEQQFYISSKRLAANAIPTLHLKGLSTQRRPLVDITQSGNVVTEEPQISQPCTSRDLSAQMNRSQTDQIEMPGPSTSKDLSAQINRSGTDQIAKPGPSTSKGPGVQKKRLTANLFSSEVSMLTRQIRKLQAAKDKYAIKLKKALKLSENLTFQKAIKNFTAAAVIFTLLQFRETKKSKMGRRFTKKEKVMALSLYKQGPKAYRWLRHIFVLPSPITLSRMISMAALKPGINDNLFDQLKNNTQKMTSTDKLCILMFDEIALAPHFDYNRKRDVVIGFVNNGKNSTKKIADHALVFMIRGVQKHYKQAISYTFCAGSTAKFELVAQIKENVRKLKYIGFTVVATVCDQGASNVSAINHLIQHTKEKYIKKNIELRRKVFEIDDDEIVPLYDPPHLIKGIRNNLITKNLTCEIDGEQKTAKWDDLIKLYEENPAYKGIRLLPKLTEQHINPKKIMKMKVKCATQVLSASVAVNMGYLAVSDKGILDPRSKETADIILFFDNLFDSVNGGHQNLKRRSGKPLLVPLTPTSPHQTVWSHSKIVLRTMKYIDERGRFCVVPSISNWIHTIENLEYLRDQLFAKHELRSIWLRKARNTNPTCASFETAFASLLINNLNSLHSPGANCEKDSCQSFKSLNKIFFNQMDQSRSIENEINIEHLSDHILVGIENKMSNPKIMAQIEYVSGYVLKKIKTIFKRCTICCKDFYDKNQSSTYIKLKEYNKKKAYLSYPAEELIKCFSDIQDVVTNIIATDSDIPNIKNYLKTILCISCNFNFITCDKHKNETLAQLQDLASRFFLYNWCKDTNKILKGSRLDFDPKDVVQNMAYNYYLKRKK